MPRYKVSIETYFGYNEGTFDAETKSKAVYKMYKYLFKKPFSFKEFLIIFNPRAEQVADDALMTWCEYGSTYGFRNNLSCIDMMKRRLTKMNKAKPCPFCGSEVRITKGVYNAPFWFFKCTNRQCGAVISFDNDKANICPDVAMYNYNERKAEK